MEDITDLTPTNFTPRTVAPSIPNVEPQPLLWFTFGQNNSGGYFVKDANVCEVVCIQAANADEARAKVQDMFDNSDSCGCCGPRWNFDPDDSDGAPVPSMYGEPIELTKPTTFRKEARLHYVDGHIETIQFGQSRPVPLASPT